MNNSSCQLVTDILIHIITWMKIGLIILILALISLIFINQYYLLICVVTLGIPIIVMGGFLILARKIIKNDDLLYCLNIDAKEQNRYLRMKLEVAGRLQNFAKPEGNSLGTKDLNFTWRLLPAESISGDLFDVHEDKNRVLFWIGDVMGHGIDAGLIMVSIQSIITTLLLKFPGASIKDLLISLNMLMNRTLSKKLQNLYNTSFMLLEYINNHVRFVGQHENILVISGTEIKIIDTTKYGSYLGILEDIESTTNYGEFEFRAGNRILIYTDGITELSNADGQILGFRGFLDMVQSRVENLNLDELLVDLKVWSGKRNFTDDATLVLIEHI